MTSISYTGHDPYQRLLIPSSVAGLEGIPQPHLISPTSLTAAQAQAMPIPADPPPALVNALAAILRRLAIEQAEAETASLRDQDSTV